MGRFLGQRLPTSTVCSVGVGREILSQKDSGRGRVGALKQRSMGKTRLVASGKMNRLKGQRGQRSHRRLRAGKNRTSEPSRKGLMATPTQLQGYDHLVTAMLPGSPSPWPVLHGGA